MVKGHQQAIGIATKIHEIRISDQSVFFVFVHFISMFLLNGLDSGRFCVPESIIEMSDSLFFGN